MITFRHAQRHESRDTDRDEPPSAGVAVSGSAVIWSLLAAYAVGVAVLAVRPWPGRSPFVVAAVAPALTTIASLVWLASGDTVDASVTWVEGLGLELAFRIDALTALLGLIVAGIGVAVFVYAAGYFSAGAAGLARFAATLLAFSGSMLGLVWADSVWTLFVFWELTSVTSFLLVGHKYADASAQLAARRALLITAAGGLVLLAGLLVLTGADGTARLSELQPVGGATGAVAAVLVIVAAATKSAQVPFHVWLPGAMAAPTPVSAYLHSATMVKAGIILLAVLQPALGETGPWLPLVVGLGLATMLWGAIGALRQTDAKLILAWGTVSQLGLMVALLGVGEGKATFAAVSILVAHAVFKAALFMVVGEIDVRTGTREIGDLGGLWRSMPVAFVVAVLSGLSMAGVPPLLGFAAKEAGIEAALQLDGTERAVLLAGVVGGSVLTVAYTLRFLVGVFAGAAPSGLLVAPRRPAMTLVSGLLGVASLVGFVALGTVSDRVRAAAVRVDPAAEAYSLLRWPGLTTAFVISAAIVAAGAVLGLVVLRTRSRAPRPLGADAVDAMVATTLRTARRVAGVVQHGSLPGYVLTAAVVAALAAVPFVTEIDVDSLRPWDSPAQAVLGAVVLGAAIALTLVPNRLGAALGLGAVGFAVAGLFVVQGSPDLALTQLLVETVIVVGFVVGLGHLGRDFPRFGLLWRRVRIAVSALVGVAVAVALAAAGSNPTGSPPRRALVEESVETGGGNNIVNVVLTDIRALDTWGEIIVLVAVAVGVVSLARAGRDEQAEPRVAPAPEPERELTEVAS